VTELPIEWAWTTLGFISTPPQYGWTTKARVDGDGLKLLRTTDITRGSIDWPSVPYCTEPPPDPARYLLAENDIVISRAGSVGASARIGTSAGAVFASYLIRFRPIEVEAAYIEWFLKSPFYWDQVGVAAAGIALQNINAKKLAQIRLPLPPLAEQRRIVAAIEEEFSRVEAASESLLRAKNRLTLLLSSALSSAVAGDWPIKPLDEIAHTTSGGTPSRRRPDYFGGPIPWVKSGELRDGRVGTTEETITELGLAESSAKIFQRGTLLIALYGATVGKLGILEIDAATNQAVCAIRPHDPEMVPYLRIVLRQKRAELVAAGQGGAQPNISQAILRKLRIPVPPPDEQRRIVAEVEHQLSLVDALRDAIASAQRRVTALRRSILARAFRGDLVPQDSNDEPASVLLERIADERAAALTPAGKRRVRMPA
jgi:type I restriction enzyme S subunit